MEKMSDEEYAKVLADRETEREAALKTLEA
jgi:hypothetical protein